MFLAFFLLHFLQSLRMTPGSPQPQQWIPRPHVEAPPALSFSISWRSIAISLARTLRGCCSCKCTGPVLGDQLLLVLGCQVIVVVRTLLVDEGVQLVFTDGVNVDEVCPLLVSRGAAVAECLGNLAGVVGVGLDLVDDAGGRLEALVELNGCLVLVLWGGE